MSDQGHARCEPGWTLRFGDYYHRHEFYIWWTCYGYSNGRIRWRKPFPWELLFRSKPTTPHHPATEE